MFPKGTASLLALWTGRASVAVTALGLATLAMLALDPRAMWDRWFLSFAGLTRVRLPAWAWLCARPVRMPSDQAAHR